MGTSLKKKNIPYSARGAVKGASDEHCIDSIKRMKAENEIIHDESGNEHQTQMVLHQRRKASNQTVFQNRFVGK